MITPAKRAARLRQRGLPVVALLLVAACSRATSTAAVQADRPATAGAEAQHGMVVSASAIASKAGRDVLAGGGNAVDAAIATGFALSVTYPTAGNIGGGGFMVIRMPDGRATTIDFREKAPAAASPQMFTDSTGAYSSKIHHRSLYAVGVSGTVAGFALAHQKYGKADWKSLVDPAVKLAGDGFDVPAGLAASLSGALTRSFTAYPASIAEYSKNGTAYSQGEHLKLPDLSRTLARIRDQGRDGFYKGETARLIAAEMKRGGGLITEADLAAYEAKERAPVTGKYRGYDIIGMAPPSSGGVTMVEILNILEGYDLKAEGHNSPEYVHLVTEAMRRAFLDRARYLGDPDFVKMPVERLDSKAYAAELRKTISRDRATPSVPEQITMAHESDETTHFSVVDANGMAVSVTYTLEAGYGVGAVVPGAGFLLNNQMGDFNGKPGLTDTTGLIGTAANVAMPAKRMLSSMAPSIIARDGKLVAVVGSPGGRTIINTVLEVVLNVIDFGMPIQAAVTAPRFHHQWLPDVISVEKDGLPPATVKALQAMGHAVKLNGTQGTAHCILVDGRGMRIGGVDPRDKDAGAVGY
ncbi:MAG TPA: gamma-glutamyltransferase [Gemmatimonadaceae bacterium]|jgi:gamma-glutamyltranspeptidase/glutathione hydrolase|nr:gamma-glutamyltransferase [Gemmatimonadaceae bacterium]